MMSIAAGHKKAGIDPPASDPIEGTLAQFSGAPRSVIWRGGAIHLRAGGENREIPDLHAHFAIQLTIGICHEVSLRRGKRGTVQLSEGWMLGSDQPHWLSGNGPCATIFLDPLSDAGRRTASHIGNTGAVPFTHIHYQTLRHELEECWLQGWQMADLRRTVMRMVDLIAPPGTSLPVMDARVQRVIDDLQKDSSENISLGDLAGKMGLSESRLAHLFRREVGIPMRQYRLWLRMGKAIEHIARGSSLTTAAHIAGFSDSSQFCRICRRMTGSTPSTLPKFQIG